MLFERGHNNNYLMKGNSDYEIVVQNIWFAHIQGESRGVMKTDSAEVCTNDWLKAVWADGASAKEAVLEEDSVRQHVFWDVGLLSRTFFLLHACDFFFHVLYSSPDTKQQPITNREYINDHFTSFLIPEIPRSHRVSSKWCQDDKCRRSSPIPGATGL